MTHLPEQKFPESLVVETREDIAKVILDPAILDRYIEHKVFHLLKNKLDLELYIEELVEVKTNPSPNETERQREVAALHLDFIRRWLAKVIEAIAPLDSDDPMDFGRVGNVLGEQSEMMKLSDSEDTTSITFIEREIYDIVVELNYQSYGASLGSIAEKMKVVGPINSILLKNVNEHMKTLLEKKFITRSVSKDGVGSVTYSLLNSKINLHSTIGASQGLDLEAWKNLWAIPFEAIPAVQDETLALLKNVEIVFYCSADVWNEKEEYHAREVLEISEDQFNTFSGHIHYRRNIIEGTNISKIKLEVEVTTEEFLSFEHVPTPDEPWIGCDDSMAEAMKTPHERALEGEPGSQDGETCNDRGCDGLLQPGLVVADQGPISCPDCGRVVTVFG